MTKTTGRTGQSPGKTPAKKKTGTEERRALIKDRIEQNGLWNIHKSNLAKELGVNRDTILEDFKVILANVDQLDLKEAEVHIAARYKDVFDEMYIMASNPDLPPKDRTSAAKAMATIGQNFTEHLEAYGAKKQVAQLVEHSGEIKTKLFAVDPGAWYKSPAIVKKEEKK